MLARTKIVKAVFVYDGNFQKYQGIYYSGGGFPSRNWQRYLRFSAALTVAARSEVLSKVPVGGVVSSAEGVEFVNVPNISGPVKLLKNYFAAKRVLRKVIKTKDLVIVRLPSEIGLLAISVCNRLKVPYALELVGDVKESMRGHGSVLGIIYSSLAYARTKRAVSSANACIYVTRNYLQDIYPCRGIVGHASNVSLVTEPAEEIESRIIGKITKRAPEFGIVGSFKTDYKGVDIAIHALAILKKRGVCSRVRVLGSGDPSRYQALAAELDVENEIRFDGVRPSSSEVVGWLDSLSYYIQPSKTEGLPRALIEAMSRGLPALGSDRGGIPELLNESCIFKNLDPERLADLMECFIRMDKDSYYELAIRNYNHSKNYELGALDSQRAEFWDRVVSLVADKGVTTCEGL